MVRVPPAAATVFAESEAIQGAGAVGQFTVKLGKGGLSAPPAETTTFTEFTGPIGMLGTVAMIDVSVQLPLGTAGVFVSPNFTVPTAAPKFLPVIVTGVVRGPRVGEMFVMHGPVSGQVTVKLAGALSLPPADTTTVVGPTGTAGTGTTIAEADQEVTF